MSFTVNAYAPGRSFSKIQREAKYTVRETAAFGSRDGNGISRSDATVSGLRFCAVAVNVPDVMLQSASAGFFVAGPEKAPSTVTENSRFDATAMSSEPPYGTYTDAAAEVALDVKCACFNVPGGVRPPVTVMAITSFTCMQRLAVTVEPDEVAAVAGHVCAAAWDAGTASKTAEKEVTLSQAPTHKLEYLRSLMGGESRVRVPNLGPPSARQLRVP